MKKYLLVAILAATFATPALATDSWYLSYNGKKCEIFAEKHQDGNWNTMAVYPTRQAAEKAKHKTDKCQKDQSEADATRKRPRMEGNLAQRHRCHNAIGAHAFEECLAL